MVSPDGWLFDKEALLKYIIQKKQEYARKLKEYERQKDRDLKVNSLLYFWVFTFDPPHTCTL
jgi:hypothetical protein